MIRLLVVLLVAIVLGMIHDTHGHGIGEETLPPQSLGDKQVLIKVNAIDVQDSGTDQQFTFELIDTQGDAVGGVTYEIIASKQKTILFDEIFESSTGTLVIDLVHSDSGTISVEKKASGIFGFISGDTDLARVTGPYFDYGGLYQFDIMVRTADGFSNLDPPLKWSSGISIADTTTHTIQDINYGEQILTHISYYDVIENFAYDHTARSISFEMPFDASFDSINQTAIIHEEVSFSKGFGDLMISNITATVNGIKMPDEVIQIDDFTENLRIVHLTMIKSNILELYEEGISEDRLSFVMAPSGPDLPYSTVTRNGQFRIVMEAVPVSGQEVEIRYRLMDVFLKDRPVRADHDIRVVQANTELFSASGTSGVGFESVKFPVLDITGIVHVHFENIAGNPLASASMPIVIDRAVHDVYPVTGTIPEWVKNSAGWWSEGIISDDEFVRAIQFLIEIGVIIVQSVDNSDGTSADIPEWVKNSAGWWSEGIISDDEFVRAIQFLIEIGVIDA